MDWLHQGPDNHTKWAKRSQTKNCWHRLPGPEIYRKFVRKFRFKFILVLSGTIRSTFFNFPENFWSRIEPAIFSSGSKWHSGSILCGCLGLGVTSP